MINILSSFMDMYVLFKFFIIQFYCTVLPSYYKDIYIITKHQLTLQDYQRSMNTINQTVICHPPPGNKLTWLTILWVVWVVIALVVYTLWVSLDLVSILITIPILMFLTTAVFIWRHQHTRCKVRKIKKDLLLC